MEELHKGIFQYVLDEGGGVGGWGEGERHAIDKAVSEYDKIEPWPSRVPCHGKGRGGGAGSGQL